jgi:5-(carboxyamino)imidazole ribonucleotide mutase
VVFNKKNKPPAKIAIVMGSQSDYRVMKNCEKILRILKIKFETKIISAHRTPNRMLDFAKSAKKNKFASIIAGAGGSAHLPGMIASVTTLPVIGVPIETKKLKGLDSLLSICQMPQGVPVATVAIDGAFNAGLLAAAIIGTFDEKVKSNLEKWRRVQTQSIKKRPK